jgi:tRNA pseudouridine38-40 synthase
MGRNFKLIIEYDGTAYHGWQRQPDAPTLQETIETALTVMTRRHIRLTAAGRTDAGVHAWGQVANFHYAGRLKAEDFQRGLNRLLPADIVIRSCRAAADDFHARYDARSKIYHYRIRNHPLPAAIGRRYAWHIRQPLDLEALHGAAAILIGRYDFKAFEGSGSPRAHSVRRVRQARFCTAAEGLLVFCIEADGFLRHMVRNIVGTLVDVGRGRTSIPDFGDILRARDRTRAGATAPAHGLFLVAVHY